MASYFDGKQDAESLRLRAVALGRADAIIKAHGLDPDDFDIPGRKRTPKPQPSRYRSDLFEHVGSPFFTGGWTQGDLDEVMERVRATVDLQRKQAEQLRREVREEELRRRQRPDADVAANFLWSLDPPIHVYRADGGSGPRSWTIPDLSALLFSDEGLIEVAESHGWSDLPPEPFTAAVAFLKARGIAVRRVGPGLWHCQGANVAAKVIILAAKLRGFKP